MTSRDRTPDPSGGDRARAPQRSPCLSQADVQPLLERFEALCKEPNGRIHASDLRFMVKSSTEAGQSPANSAAPHDHEAWSGEQLIAPFWMSWGIAHKLTRLARRPASATAESDGRGNHTPGMALLSAAAASQPRQTHSVQCEAVAADV